MKSRLFRSTLLAGVAVIAIGALPARAGNVTGSLYVGPSYLGAPHLQYSYNGATQNAGGSIDPSSLNGQSLAFLYCIDIPDDVPVGTTYEKTRVSDDASVWLAGSNPTTGLVTLENAGSVAYLVLAYGNYANANGPNAVAALQAAIWNVIYYGHTTSSSTPLFQFDAGYNATTTGYFNTFMSGVTNGSTDPNDWKTSDVADVLWFSPSHDGNFQTGTIYQALVSAVPEPASIVAASTAFIALAGPAGYRRRRPVNA